MTLDTHTRRAHADRVNAARHQRPQEPRQAVRPARATRQDQDQAEAVYIPTPCGILEIREVLPGRWEPVRRHCPNVHVAGASGATQTG